MATRKRNSTESRRTLLLVTATEAEALFFSQMRKDCRYGNLTVVCAGAKDLKHLISCTTKEKNRKKYDVAFALFGFDDVNTNTEEVRAAEEVCAGKRIQLCYFNPGFSLWLYLHLGKPQRFIADASVFEGEVSKAIPGLEWTPEYLLTDGLNLHMKLFPRHSLADQNARDYNKLAIQATGEKATTMPELNKMITEVCGQADMSHNTKVFK